MKCTRPAVFQQTRCANVFFILLAVSGLIPCSAFSQQYLHKFKYLTVDDGLSHTDANDIAQDQLGYIWVATYFGLSRYDGYSVKKFYNDSLPLNNALKNRIVSLCPDSQGNIWLGTEDGLQRFDVRTERYADYHPKDNGPVPVFQKLFTTDDRQLYGIASGRLWGYTIEGTTLTEKSFQVPLDLEFYDITSDRTNRIYLASNRGLWTLDSDGTLKSIPLTGLPAQEISSVRFDNRNRLLVAYRNTVYALIPALSAHQRDAQNQSNGQTLIVDKKFECLQDKSVKSILQDNRNNYWAITSSDLVELDSTFRLIQVTNKASFRGLNSNSLSKIFIDRSACLWICTFGGGVNYCDLNEKSFNTMQHDGVQRSLSGNYIRSVMEDRDELWIGTMDNGLNLYNLKTKSFTYFNTSTPPSKLKNDIISALALDRYRNLWIGSAAGIEILKPDRKTLWQPPGYEKFPTYVIETLTEDYYGNIWFGNHVNRFGVLWKDKQNHFQVRYYDEGYYILADKKKPQVWISSTHGLKRAIIDSTGNILKTFWYRASANSNSLSSNYTYPVCKQNDSTWWIGTIGGGLNRLILRPDDSYNIKRYDRRYGVFNDVESLEIDKDENIWMGGNGLECFNPKSGRLIRYDKNDGLQGNSFKVGASAKGADGKLYFGGINGLNYFYPDQIKLNNILPKPVLTDILINNEKPGYGSNDSSQNYISQAVGYCRHLQLSYLQNNFVIAFSSMHFANPMKCMYRYRLIGFDKSWKFTDGRNPTAAYSNLNYDSYTFVVEATNNDGIWSPNRAEIEISMMPPWWKSPIAKTVYALLALVALSGIYIYQARWHRLKTELEVRAVNEKQKEILHQQREELYQQQLTFFTNISHEFRTPLTLILGPLESLINQNKNNVLDNSYQLMFRNAKRLINLINELMNFKKVADSAIKLHVQPLAISQFCKDLSMEFQNLAISKDIYFSTDDVTAKNAANAVTGVFDVQVLEKILFNLLSNSFKYTPIGGRIDFQVLTDLSGFTPSFDTGFEVLNENHRAKKYIYFRIGDSGIGISGDSLKNIFERYYRISRNHMGSGVGLALVKSLTELHKGDIYVYSERHKGTEIIIGIPWGDENYNQCERTPYAAQADTQLEAIDNSTLIPFNDFQNEKSSGISKINKHILLVDDNQELRAFLKQTLEKYYYIYEAEDGNAALEIAVERVPDLIISDVMMPGMNGIDLCGLVKEKFETSHIPFIILSAKDALDTKIQGMESGADFYFAKPLSIDLLLLTVHNIFEQSKKLKLRYTSDYLSEATELVHSCKDKDFMQKLLTLVEENLQDERLDADFLCERLYISRTKLYQKIKSITDQSVAEFIRTIRLKKAVQIMTNEDVGMNDVADRIGMQSLSSFSRAFKREFGKSPLQFLQSLKKD